MDTVFKLKESEEFGQYLVSNVNLDEGQTIYIDSPFLTSPKEFKSRVPNSYCCVVCLKMLNLKTGSLCQVCKWPVCCNICAHDEVHASECKLFSQKKVWYSQSRMSYLKVLRVVLGRMSSPCSDFHSFMYLSSDIESCEESFKEAVKKESREVHDFLVNVCGLEVTKEEVLQIMAILKINRFTIDAEDLDGNRYDGHAVFKVASKFAHSCAPNLGWVIEKEVGSKGTTIWKMRLHTRSKVRQGDILTIAYSYEGLNLSTARRIALLRSAFPFDCLCSRCKDATEENTFFSSSICRKCKKGNILAIDPLKSDTCSWKCDSCSNILPADDIMQELSVFETEIKKLKAMEPSHNSMKLLDAFIEQNTGQTLNNNHFIMFEAKLHWLLEGDHSDILLGSSEEAQDLFTQIMSRAEECLTIAKKFSPTLTLVELEFLLARTTAEFAFKSADAESLTSAPNKRKLKIFYSEKVLTHLSKALEWQKFLPTMKDLQDYGQVLGLLKDVWIEILKEYMDELEALESEFREMLLSRLPMS